MKQISSKKWNAYRNALAKINEEAAALVVAASNKGFTEAAYTELVKSIAMNYGDASAELACKMFEETAKAQGVKRVVARPVNDINANGVSTVLDMYKGNAEAQGRGIGVLVKKQASKTTMYNARRYGCEVAWIPSGDACAFCLMLASNGWRVGRKAYSGDEDIHAHNNCKCEFAVRFDSSLDVEGYDPDALYQEYKEKGLNGMRREHYEEHKDEINEQKREAYARRKELEAGEE